MFVALIFRGTEMLFVEMTDRRLMYSSLTSVSTRYSSCVAFSYLTDQLHLAFLIPRSCSD